MQDYEEELLDRYEDLEFEDDDDFDDSFEL